MPLITGRGLTQNADNVFIHTDGQNRPITVVAVIHRQDTDGRDNPPQCLSGFNTAGTPFALGHVVALELGGADVSANIVPQYGLWQGNGAWRLMETTIRNGAAQAMVVRMTYNAVGDTYDTQKQAFTAGNKLFHWTDARIPVRFQVWTTTQASIQDYLDADANGKAAAIDQLVTDRGGETYNHPIIAMPAIDRTYWQQQMVRAAARAAHQDYYIAQAALRQNAIFAAAPPRSGGPIRRPTRRALQALNLPPEPIEYNAWVQNQVNLAAVATALQNNANNVSLGWTNAERQGVTGVSVAQAIFA